MIASLLLCPEIEGKEGGHESRNMATAAAASNTLPSSLSLKFLCVTLFFIVTCHHTTR